MDEQQLLSRLRRGDEQALAAVIARFSAYVVTVIHNRSRGLLSPEDEDELASSTFFALWQSCRTVKAGSIRAWLGSVARNKTVDRLVFKTGDEAKPNKDFPNDAVYGKKLKAPKEAADVNALVVADYQEYLEEKWVGELRKRYTFTVNEDVVNTVNKH